MENSEEPNTMAFYELLGKIGPEYLTGVPDRLKDWLQITSEDTDEFFPGGMSPVDTLYDLWGSGYTPEEAVESALDVWLDNIKDSIMDNALVSMEYGGDYDKLEEIAGRINFKDLPKLIKRLVTAAAPEESKIPVESLKFELLPPGTWSISDVIAHYRREKERLHEGSGGQIIDTMRLISMSALRPEKCYVGSEQWLGYVVFEFTETDKVVLECPIEGNATYVLSGDWKSMVGHSKQYLRENYPDRCTKVVHKGDWLNRVRAALFH